MASEQVMPKIVKKGAEEARNQLPELLSAAQRGRQTIITRHGRPVAVLGPISSDGRLNVQRSILSLRGSAQGLYNRNEANTSDLRDEWDR